MMAEIYLITGGVRSGKSRYAGTLAEGMQGDKIYLATAPYCDEEMAARIANHQQVRAGHGWTTIEEQIDLSAVFTAASANAIVLVDCLTLWLNNLLFRQAVFTEMELRECWQKVDEILTLKPDTFKVIFVSNEVGMGLIPTDSLTRRYIDLIGLLNQLVAGRADQVIYMVSGLALSVKDRI